MSYIYNGKFEGNILVVGRTGCGKTGFIQKLAVNKFFGELVKAEWVSYIKLDKQREAELQSCFDTQLDFYYPRNKEQFENLLEHFKKKSETSDQDSISDGDFNVNSLSYGENYGEKSQRNRLIVMDDVSGLADLSIKFANFLTIARKYRYHCVYIFHTAHPEKSVWKTIMSQTNMFNVFPASVPIGTIKKILEANCIHKTTKYIPVNSLWITKLFIQLANNESHKTCLTIDCTGLNSNGPGRFRTGSANSDSQTCFFNKADDETLFNVFVSKRIKKDVDPNKILFEIEGLKTEADNDIYSASLELENLQGNSLSNVRAPASNSRFDAEDGNSSRKFRNRRKSARPKFLSRR